VSEAEQESILSELRALVQMRGWQRLVAPEAPRALAADPIERSASGLRAPLRRLMKYVGIVDVDARVETNAGKLLPDFFAFGVSEASPHEGEGLWFAGLVRGVAFFGVNRPKIGSGNAIRGALAHAVAHAYRARHGFRHADEVIEERLVDVTAIYLGLGSLIEPRSLTADEVAFAIAARRNLATDADLRERLGVPEPSRWPRADAAELARDVLDEALADEAAVHVRNAPYPIGKTYHHARPRPSPIIWAAGGAALGVLVWVVLTYSLEISAMAGMTTALALGVAGALLGRARVTRT
jgi:hypothetical protein